MTCPRCQQENPAEALFCMKCGTVSRWRAPSANTSCRRAQSSVSHAGNRCPLRRVDNAFTSPEALHSQAPRREDPHLQGRPRSERKQVTVLFADLKGSMELLADRDPEEAPQDPRSVLQLMMEAVIATRAR